MLGLENAFQQCSSSSTIAYLCQEECDPSEGIKLWVDLHASTRRSHMVHHKVKDFQRLQKNCV